jgi:hypothetical protein
MNGSTFRRRASYALVWAAFLVSAAITAVSLPMCYVPRAAQGWIQKNRVQRVLGPIFALSAIDRSGASVVAVTLFLGVCLRRLENRGRFEAIQAVLGRPGVTTSPRSAADDPLLFGLLDNRSGPVRIRLDTFARELFWETSLIKYENALVVIGLLGTLAGFLLGFYAELGQVTAADLQARADNLFMVIGTATLSSIVGIGLGMLAVRAIAEQDAIDLDRLVGRAREVLEAQP